MLVCAEGEEAAGFPPFRTQWLLPASSTPGRAALANQDMNDKAHGPHNWQNPAFMDSDNASRLAAMQRLGAGLRQKTAAGWALGTFVIELPAPATLGALALAGFDFVVLDMEHSAIELPTIQNLVLAGQAAGLAVLVRPSGTDAGLIGRILDTGANGLMVPHVDSAERARAIVAQTRFPPLGRRGFSPLMRFDALARPLAELNDSTFLVLQIEGRAAIENAAAIAAVPGFDALFVGPYDLALSLGVPPGSERVRETALQLAGSMAGDVALGIYVDDPARCGDWAAQRFALQCVSFDGRLLAGAARALVATARQSMPGKRRGG